MAQLWGLIIILLIEKVSKTRARCQSSVTPRGTVESRTVTVNPAKAGFFLAFGFQYAIMVSTLRRICGLLPGEGCFIRQHRHKGVFS